MDNDRRSGRLRPQRHFHEKSIEGGRSAFAITMIVGGHPFRQLCLRHIRNRHAANVSIVWSTGAPTPSLAAHSQSGNICPERGVRSCPGTVPAGPGARRRTPM